MFKLDFEKTYNDVATGKKPVQDAVKEISVFIQNNYRLFTARESDEDFKSDIVLSFLQKGYRVFEKYEKSSGPFFNYFYSYVKGIIMTESKARAKRRIHEKISVYHSLEQFFEMEEKNDFTLVVEDSMHVPYAYKPFTRPLFEQTIKGFMKDRKNVKRLSKSIVVLALRAVCDITDDEIKMICNEFCIDINDFYRAVEILKKDLAPRKAKRQRLMATRNQAYCNHMHYSESFARHSLNTEYIKSLYKYKFLVNTKRWNETNNRLLKGHYSLVPTNKAIGEVLGISSRQVCYYVRKFKKELDEIRENKIAIFGNIQYDSEV